MHTTRSGSYVIYGALLFIPLLPACELIPGLLAEPPPGASAAALSVSVDSAEGEFEGQALSLEQLEAHGVQQHGGVELSVRVGADTTLQLVSPEPFGGSDNPYGGPDSPRRERDPSLPDPSVPEPTFPGDDAGTGSGISAGPQPFVLVCSPASCREPAAFEMRSVEASDGRHVVFEGQWDGGDRAAIELHYRREP